MFVRGAFNMIAYGIVFCFLVITPFETEVRASDSTAKIVRDIQKVTSSGGIEAWLVERHALPFFTLVFSFKGGSDQDPTNRFGVSNFLSLMLDQGAGDLQAAAFQRRIADIAMHLSFKSEEDRISGRLEVLTEHRKKAVELLRLALNQPRFDHAAMGRTRQKILANLTRNDSDPHRVAMKTWNDLAFPGSPKHDSHMGTEESVRSISGHDLSAYHKRVFARDGLRVVAVGNIDPAKLRLLLDKVFGPLPAKQRLIPVGQLKIGKGAQIEIVDMPVDNSVMVLGVQGIRRTDPDFVAAEVMNHILGGDYDFSRLWSELREKRGLVYSASSRLNPDKISPTLTFHADTRHENVPQVINIIRREMRRIAAGGVSSADLSNAKDFLIGSFALNFKSNAIIADFLLWVKENKFGIDYLRIRNAKIDAVNLDDIQRVAKRLLKIGQLKIAIVGKHRKSEICGLASDL